MDSADDLDRRCAATTVKGKPCRRRPVVGSDLCSTHVQSAAGASRVQPPADGRVVAAARPDSITEDMTVHMERLLAAGNYIAVACQVVGLPRSTYQEWMAKGSRDGPGYTPYRIFAQRIEVALAKGEATKVAQIARAASGEKGDWKAAAWMLERQVPERWAKPSQRVHSESAEGHAQQASTGEPGLRDLLAQMKQQQVTPGQG